MYKKKKNNAKWGPFGVQCTEIKYLLDQIGLKYNDGLLLTN